MYRQAIKWHTLAASRGVAASHYHLGLMKAYGRGFNQDFSGAVIHFQQVATGLPCCASVRAHSDARLHYSQTEVVLA
jgi:TPR repeat protein